MAFLELIHSGICGYIDVKKREKEIESPTKTKKEVKYNKQQQSMKRIQKIEIRRGRQMDLPLKRMFLILDSQVLAASNPFFPCW
mmetsp:Transcript_63690/g.73016  ORF Transcript_63690/g.73016 Transcript_63690/m.73016 type:complete len:84 (+) Transcript_63690:31-282(+)